MNGSKHSWTFDGPNIMSPDILKTVEQSLVRRGSIIVEHRIMNGGGNPYRLVFDDIEEFKNYLNHNAHPGDNILVWSYEELCRDENVVTTGKYPDTEGRTPGGGSY